MTFVFLCIFFSKKWVAQAPSSLFDAMDQKSCGFWFVLTDVSVEIPRCQDAKANVEGMLPLPQVIEQKGAC